MNNTKKNTHTHINNTKNTHFVDCPLSSSELLVSSIIQSCSLARGLVVSQHHCLSPPRAARVESVVFSRSCNATLLSRVLLLRSSWHSMSRPPWHSMALRRRLMRTLVFDKLFACPRADPRVLFRTLLQSSAALVRRCAGWIWSAGLTSATCVPPASVRGGHCFLATAITRHPAQVANLSTDATVLRVFRLVLRVAIPPKLCCDSPQLSPLRLATCLMVSGHFSTQTCLC